ncbi:MAG: lipopolysaccharide biosynthesis protein [Planctomycetota bacterium]|nr:lipopolysaccharide biosynthesis protein [Planctomycetota bacterium]
MISGTNFVTAVMIGRCCDNGELGVYYLVLTGVFFLLGLQEQLISAPYTVYSNRRQGRALSTYAGSVLVHQSIVIIGSVVLPLAVMSALAAGYGPIQLLPVCRILVWSLPLMLMRGFIREQCFAHLELQPLILMDIAACVVQIGGLWWLMSSGDMAVSGVYTVLGIAAGVVLPWWFRTNRHRFDFDRNQCWADWKANWSFSKWAMTTHVIGSSTPYVMPWVLFSIHGDIATGLLASCSAVVGLSNMVLAGIANFLTPRAARAYADDGVDGLKCILRKLNTLFVVMLGSVCVLAAFVGQNVIDVVYDGKFQDTGAIVFTLSLAVLANAFGVSAGNGLWAVDRPRANLLADALTLLTAFAGAFAFIPLWGAFGAALAILTANAVGASTRQFVLRQTLKSISNLSNPAT